MTKEIENFDDIVQLVDSFYARVREDELLGPIFNGVIQDRWPEHLDKLYRFWETILLKNPTYMGSPFVPHARLPINLEHFERWLSLFRTNLVQQFHGPIAEEAMERASKMAAMFHHKITYYREHPSISIQ